MLKGEDILFLSGIRWDFSFQRHQRLATLLSRNNRVLFVEGGLSPLNLFRERRATLQHWKHWIRGIREIQPGLFLYTSPPLLPLGRSVQVINRLNQFLVFRGARRAGRKLRMKKFLIWISDPYFSRFAHDHGQRLTIFDWIHDDTSGSGNGRDRVYRRLREETLRGAQLVFTPSRVLYQRHGTGDPRFYVIPHGVDLPLAAGEPPEEIAGIKPLIIGFVGTIGPTVDLELLEFLAEKRPDWSLVLIGEVRGNPGNLRNRGNVYLLGPRPIEQLPGYIVGFSVGIIPYRINPATATVLPVKTYEYLAAGIPVVSTRLPELLPLEGVIRLAELPEEFLSALEKALKENRPEDQKLRIELAGENSWEQRLAEIEAIIRQHLPAEL